MTFESDKLIDRIRLKKALKKWRLVAICALVLVGVILLAKSANITPNYIARVTIDDVIIEDKFRDKALKELAENKGIKAVILYLDSPGGSMVGGENLHESIVNIKKKKPVVTVMGSLATSAAYMVASASDYIVAHNGTLTGSIGVLLQTAEVKELIDKIGVKVAIIKSGPLKGEPDLFNKMTPETRKALQSLIDVSHKYFVELVSRNRKIPVEKAYSLADGRVFTGLQAKENALVDIVGTEADAVKWLENNKNIRGYEIKDYKIKEEPGSDINSLLTGLFGKYNLIPPSLRQNGLISIWTNTSFTD